MVRVAIVTDGPYGERAHKNICEEFETDFIELEAPTGIFADEVEIPHEKIGQIVSADIVITYILHPDLTLELVDRIHNDVDWIIVGAWRGEGFRNQLLGYGNVTAPENMCDLEENGNPSFDEFVSKFGKPVVEVDVEDDIVKEIRVLRCSPCGATRFVAEELVGTEVKDLPVRAGLKIQHYPCRAAKMRLFADDECKKELAARTHCEAFERALENQ
ncbi:DUF166 domain-containing protein [Methanothermobacter sp. K4]|uniref:DUF166 domain-containing protein n=1 Tax=Methanothermobacter sp. K4 TaxID=2913262 RepID=UPI001EDB83C4|nr:DUF166 domain-containing protein [Methanothermobacter sp. K4]MCG2827999.1 DUF166 domain-containing protein [Methanothermobacter sp. K4]